jgi:hypothetical protein
MSPAPASALTNTNVKLDSNEADVPGKPFIRPPTDLNETDTNEGHGLD